MIMILIMIIYIHIYLYIYIHTVHIYIVTCIATYCTARSTTGLFSLVSPLTTGWVLIWVPGSGTLPPPRCGV
jgi:hypothetical protein